MKKIFSFLSILVLVSAKCFAADLPARSARASDLESGRAIAVDASRAAIANQRTAVTSAPGTGQVSSRSAASAAATERTQGQSKAITSRSATTQSVNQRASGISDSRVNTARAAANTMGMRGAQSAVSAPAIGRPAAPVASRNVARAATTDTNLVSNTRTGAEYEKCKNAYFACMDQFCAMKDSNYQRCSCSDKIYDLKNIQDVMQDAADNINVFNENLDTVGMTAAQAAAMRIASEGENALTKDGSSSKALLQAIMNSIRGEDSSVDGKFSDLNPISIRMDSATAFGFGDVGQTIAAYNGKNLYTAVYGQCREAVRADCNDASLQRAVTAYLMAIEQDCNTVQKMLDDNKKQLTSAVRESSAMLELARVENRQKHNISDMTTCLREVEEAIQSEQVCGANYYKCLDNGQYIDIQTGKPIVGVVDFYKLGELLTFNKDASITDQKLSKVTSNRLFVTGFESRVKKFAEPALDKCAEKSAEVWADYLDKALLDIYYAQNAKVAEIREGCMDFVSVCYMNGEKALTDSMAGIMDKLLLTPDFITVSETICRDYVSSCNNMFSNPEGGGIIEQYISQKTDTDMLVACRAIVQQCFDQYGGTGYANYYNLASGLFLRGMALEWFTLRDLSNGNAYVSPCAKQLASVTSCSAPDIMEKVFGGFDKKSGEYGLIGNNGVLDPKKHRYTGVATEAYNTVVDTLTIQCDSVFGRFVEKAFLTTGVYSDDDPCDADFNTPLMYYKYLIADYHIGTDANGFEDMCPANYSNTVDTKSWGACLCWENGARRSANGKSVQCAATTWDPADGVYIQGHVNINGKVCPFAMDEDRACCSRGTGILNEPCGSNESDFYNLMFYVPDSVIK